MNKILNNYWKSLKYRVRENKRGAKWIWCPKIRGARKIKFRECAKIRGARKMKFREWAKIRGAKIKGAKIKGARKFKGIRLNWPVFRISHPKLPRIYPYKVGVSIFWGFCKITYSLKMAKKGSSFENMLKLTQFSNFSPKIT